MGWKSPPFCLGKSCPLALALMPATSVSPSVPLVPFQLLLQCRSSEGTPELNPCWCLQPQVMGTYLPGTGILCWGAWYGTGTPRSWNIPPESTTCICGTSLFCVSISPTSLDGCVFFNSVVVRFPFRSISDGSSVMVVLQFSCNFDVVVRRGELCLSVLPCWPVLIFKCICWSFGCKVPGPTTQF